MAHINQNTVCLVSGGGRGITAQAAIALARQYQCKFILLGRSTIDRIEPEWAQDCSDEMTLKKRILEHLLHQNEKPTPKMVQREYKSIALKREIEQTLDLISKAGGQAEYLSVDITDRNAVMQISAVEARLGKVTAIVHGAGNLADKPIEKKTEQDFDLVYAPKVKGLENLLRCIDSSQLECLVLFSSVVGFYGNAGQTDYAIANDILNKTAYAIGQKYPQCHTVAINWGPWDSGMVSPQLKQAFTERGIKTIPIDVGTQMLIEELGLNNSDVQVVIGSPLKPPIAFDNKPQTYKISRRLSLAANPFLYDHVIMDRPVLPATCAISWMANTCEQLYPGYKFFNNSNFRVLKGIVFDDNLADRYILDLEKKVSDSPEELNFNAKIWSKNKLGKVRYHFSSELKLTSSSNDLPQYDSFNLSPEETNFSQEKSLYQQGEKFLFHGACFQGVRKVLNVSKDKLTMECFLSEVSTIEQGQFPVQTFNPYIVDVQIHSFWLWLQHNYQEICLPSEIETYEQFAATDFERTFYVSCEIKSKTKTAVVADVITHDREGKVYSRMSKAKGTIVSF